MNTKLTPPRRSSMTRLLLHGLALVLVLLAPALGMATAAVATWHSLLAGSIWYLPLGLVLVLTMIAILESHKPFDLVLLGLLALGVVAWFRVDALQQGLFVDSLQELAIRTSLMVGLLLIMTLALALCYTMRLVWPASRPHAAA